MKHKRTVDVVLVSMPWAPPTEPSLALGILKSCLRDADFSVKVYHAAPRLLRYVTLQTYSFLSERAGINEFLFTATIEPSCDDDQLQCLLRHGEIIAQERLHPNYDTAKKISHLCLQLRDHIIPRFLRECVRDITSYAPRLVGFTCMFDQTIASVALARLLKEESKDLRIVLGGYALEGKVSEMVAASFPWIDNIVLGDGEKLIVDLMNHRQGIDTSSPWLDNIALGYGELSVINLTKGRQGSLSTKLEASSKIMRSTNVNLDTSPIPEYDDWYHDLRALAHEDKVSIKTEVLPVESSRGCWWGQHKHCIFCGIDEDTLKYRQKSADNVIRMLRTLRSRHGNKVAFRFSDYILPKRYYWELLPLLAKEQPRYSLKCEIKANQSNERMRLFAEAGFVELQPGIESFSTNVLRSMEKGVRGIDNVNLLKSGYENRIIINYNFLYGIPGDSVSDYSEMLGKIPRIYHLIPPAGRTEIAVTKFAPLQVDPERFGIQSKAKHHWTYDVLFSAHSLKEVGFVLDEYAYYFERNFEYGDELQLMYRQCVVQINHWKGLHRRRFVELSFEKVGERIRIIDGRFGPCESYVLNGLLAEVLLLCNLRPIRTNELWGELLRTRASLDPADLHSCLNRLDESRLVWMEGDLILGLPVEKKIADGHRKSGWPSSWPAIYV